MMYGLEAITVNEYLHKNLDEWASPQVKIDVKEDALMWVVEGQNDTSVSFAARLMEQGLNVRIVDKDIYLSGYSFSRGSVIVFQWTIQTLKK